ncbi:hypothetical protein ACFL5Q_03935 [Planctomycetota bacterium]
MTATFERYRQVARKAVDYQLGYQQPDGGYIWDGYAVDAHHKQAYSWALAGRLAEAHRLLSWVRRERLQPNGQLKDYSGDVYKHSWFFQGAHRLGRFDLSYPVIDFLVSCQAPCGGFPHFAGDRLLRSLATAWTGISAIYAGRMDVAHRAAHCSISMLEQQPDDDRFYYKMTRDGRLLVDDFDPDNLIDIAKPKQAYWEVGLPMMLMCRMYQVTGQTHFLDVASRLFEFKLRCSGDNYAWVGSGKSSLAAAIFYLITDDPRARQSAVRFLDFLTETQYPEGGWRDETEPDELLIYIDHAAEFNVWITEILGILQSKTQHSP